MDGRLHHSHGELYGDNSRETFYIAKKRGSSHGSFGSAKAEGQRLKKTLLTLTR